MNAGDVYVAKAELIVCTMGTRGDILPFLSLVAPFVKGGHKVTILTNANWRTLVENIGADFYEIADTDPSQSGRDDRVFYRANVFPSFSRSFSFIQKTVANNPNCFLIYRTNMVGAESAAERFGIPSVKVALQPCAIRSAERPPWPLASWVCGPFAGLVKKLVIPALFCVGELFGQYRAHTSAFRVTVGLTKRPPNRAKGGEDLLLVLSPDWFATPQKDWPASSRTIGFLYFDGEQVDHELDSFIAAEGPPLVFTPGTGVSDVQQFFSTATELCRRLDMPGVFVSPYLCSTASTRSERIIVRDYTELHHILPQARLLVHHGGIGSVAQAIRAGVPQIIFPGRFDQPDNALRVAVLGLGGAIFSKLTNVGELERFTRDILASPIVQRQVRKASRLVRAHPSNEVAYEMICRMITNRRRMPRAEAS